MYLVYLVQMVFTLIVLNSYLTNEEALYYCFEAAAATTIEKASFVGVLGSSWPKSTESRFFKDLWPKWGGPLFMRNAALAHFDFTPEKTKSAFITISAYKHSAQLPPDQSWVGIQFFLSGVISGCVLDVPATPILCL